MKKITTLLIFILSMSLSSLNSASSTNKSIYCDTNDIQAYDYTLYIGAHNGASASINVGDIIDSNHVMAAPWIEVSVNRGNVTYTLNYDEWVDGGSPQTTPGDIILSSGKRISVIIYIG